MRRNRSQKEKKRKRLKRLGAQMDVWEQVNYIALRKKVVRGEELFPYEQRRYEGMRKTARKHRKLKRKGLA